MYPLRWNQDPAPGLQYGFSATPPLSLHPFPSWISNCLNLPFGTQGGSWKPESVSYKKTGDRKAFVPRSPMGSCLVSV